MDKYKYIVSKRLEIAGCHQLDLPYESPCRESKHGHNWIVTIYIGSNDLINGMVLDFMLIKKNIHGVLDHKDFNDIFDFNPTAENIAKWICEQVDLMREGIHCFKVTVQESEGNIATYNNIDL